LGCVSPLDKSRSGTPEGVRAPLSARRTQVRWLETLRLSAFCFLFVAFVAFVPFVIASGAKQSRRRLSSGLLRRGACHRAGHFGPDPLAPRNDEVYQWAALKSCSRERATFSTESTANGRIL
jgi:hypothetical protein